MNSNSKPERNIVKDSEGIDLSDQFLSLRKTRTQGETELDSQKDENFDFRDLFFFGNEDPEEILDNILKEGREEFSNEEQKTQAQGKKRRGKKSNFVFVSKGEASIHFEDIQSFHHNDIYGFTRKNFEDKVSEYLSQHQYNLFFSAIAAFSSGKLAVDHIASEFMSIFGQKTVWIFC